MRPARPTAFAFRRSLLPLHSRPNPDSHRRDAASQGRTGRGQRIAIVTDAWKPQINGVVTTLTETSRCLREAGHTVELMTPLSFWRVPCPTYPEIRLSLFPGRRLTRMLDEFAPERVHIATEGPLGLAARSYCLRRRMPFTTSYHTQFPQYLRARLPVPTSWSYAFLRWFHGPALRTLVATESMRRDLLANGFEHLGMWSRGVDTELFRPHDKFFLHEERPILMYAGRVAVEKGLEAFLELDAPGTKYVVGDGPALSSLRRRYPDAVYAGYRFGEDLARHLAAADVFVFRAAPIPSGSSCWRHSRAVCPWPRIPSQAPSTSSNRASPARSRRISARRYATRSTSIPHPAARQHCGGRGRSRPGSSSISSLRRKTRRRRGRASFRRSDASRCTALPCRPPRFAVRERSLPSQGRACGGRGCVHAGRQDPIPGALAGREGRPGELLVIAAASRR